MDYRYDCKDVPDLSEELDYYKYYICNTEKQCNRTFCIKCLHNLNRINCKKYLVDYKCDFCLKICTCESCTIAYEIVQGLAHFKNILISNYQDLG